MVSHLVKVTDKKLPDFSEPNNILTEEVQLGILNNIVSSREVNEAEDQINLFEVEKDKESGHLMNAKETPNDVIDSQKETKSQSKDLLNSIFTSFTLNFLTVKVRKLDIQIL